jgi:hypothetical protein
MNTKKLLLTASLFVVTAFSQTSFAQGLNWEGQTGALITPFAYTAGAPASKFGKPEVAFHYLNTGNVIGNDYQFSVTEGICKHFEVGFTQSFSSAGGVVGNDGSVPINATTSTSGYTEVKPASVLFSNGYSVIHGKVTFLSENAFKTKWVPAIAVGSIGRFGVQRASFFLVPQPAGSASQTNGDFYLVATKTVTQVKGLPFVLSFGDKITDASIMGIAGNAGNRLGFGQRWQGRLFGAAAFVVKGPAKSALIFGSEALQQPRYVQGLNHFVDGLTDTSVTANIPTTLSYFVRIVPHLEGSPLQIDLGVAHIGGKITNLPHAAVDLQANAQFGMGVSYHF